MSTIILIVLIPRDVDYLPESGGYRAYQYSWENHAAKVTQYFHTVRETRSLGESKFGLSVEEEISHYFPRSLPLIIFSFLLSILTGVLKGIYDYRNKWRLNPLAIISTWCFQSVPDFLIIMSFQYSALFLMRSIDFKIPIYSFVNGFELIVPILILMLYPTMYIARITSTSLSEQERKMYITTARGKGLSDRIILFKHVLSNCWSTIFSHSSSIMLYILSNLLILEYLMFYKGAAYRLYEAMGYDVSNQRTFFYANTERPFEAELIIGLVLVFMLLVLLTQFLSQLARHYVDSKTGGE